MVILFCVPVIRHFLLDDLDVLSAVKLSIKDEDTEQVIRSA